MNEYKYSDLRAAALADPTAENLAALGEWLQEYGGRDWNGESWDIENGRRLRRYFSLMYSADAAKIETIFSEHAASKIIDALR